MGNALARGLVCVQFAIMPSNISYYITQAYIYSPYGHRGLIHCRDISCVTEYNNQQIIYVCTCVNLKGKLLSVVFVSKHILSLARNALGAV